MTREELQTMTAPFKGYYRDAKKKKVITVTGFSEGNPLIKPMFGLDLSTVYFEGGGWLMVSDLLKHYEIEH